MFLKTVLSWLIKYVLKRASGSFCEWLMDYSLVEWAKRTDNKLDDKIVAEFVKKSK